MVSWRVNLHMKLVGATRVEHSQQVCRSKVNGSRGQNYDSISGEKTPFEVLFPMRSETVFCCTTRAMEPRRRGVEMMRKIEVSFRETFEGFPSRTMLTRVIHSAGRSHNNMASLLGAAAER